MQQINKSAYILLTFLSAEELVFITRDTTTTQFTQAKNELNDSNQSLLTLKSRWNDNGYIWSQKTRDGI